MDRAWVNDLAAAAEWHWEAAASNGALTTAGRWTATEDRPSGRRWTSGHGWGRNCEGRQRGRERQEKADGHQEVGGDEMGRADGERVRRTDRPAAGREGDSRDEDGCETGVVLGWRTKRGAHGDGHGSEQEPRRAAGFERERCYRIQVGVHRRTVAPSQAWDGDSCQIRTRVGFQPRATAAAGTSPHMRSARARRRPCPRHARSSQD